MRFMNKRLTVLRKVSSAGHHSAQSSYPDIRTLRSASQIAAPAAPAQIYLETGMEHLHFRWTGTEEAGPALGAAQGSRQVQPEPGSAAWC